MHLSSGAQLSAQGGNMVSLDNMKSILHVSPIPSHEGGGALVTVQAGVRIRQLVIELAKFNLTMINLGATATQSLAGKSMHACVNTYIKTHRYTIKM
jgi:FAD/FMN-containing dehydrogenase